MHVTMQRQLVNLSNWLRIGRGRMAIKCWAWMQEHGSINAAHVHIMLYVPPELARQFAPMPLRWVKKLLPGAL